MSESLPHDESKFFKKVKLEGILSGPHDSDIGFFIQVDLKNHDIIQKKNKLIPLLSRKKS